MQIQYCSDLHIDKFPLGTPFETFVKPAAQILVVAGDICSVSNSLYNEFLFWCMNNWQKVVIIAGNHEYYCETGIVRTFDETDAIIQKICKQYNIYFLQAGQSITLPGTNLRFVGATYWSSIDPSIWSEITEKKGEFKHTYQSSQNTVRKTIPSDLNTLHALHKACIFSAIVPTSEILIVVTHHMPTMNLLEPMYKEDSWRTCYASSDEDLFASSDEDLFASNISVWICGHGHRATQQKIKDGPLLLMNARGYVPDTIRITDVYNPEAVFIVKN